MRRLVSDTLVIAERNLIRLPRAPDLLLAFTVQPIMFVLLFRYVFGGAIQTPGYSYVDFLIPGIIVQNFAFGGFVTALGLNEDVHKGDRKSTRLNSSHVEISYAVFCLKKKKNKK